MSQWRVLTNINVRESPSNNSDIIDSIPANSNIDVLEVTKDRLWLNTDIGWVSTRDNGLLNGNVTVAEIKDIPNTMMMSDTMLTNEPVAVNETVQSSEGYVPESWFWNQGQTYTTDSNGNPIVLKAEYEGVGQNMTSARAVFGMPYQFMPIADRRLNGGINEFGRVYADKIISKMPVLFLTPGRPEFMARFAKEDVDSTILSMINKVAGGDDGSKVLTRDGRYYTFRQDHVRYFNFVNPMCRTAAQFLGIGDMEMPAIGKIGSTPLKYYNWGDGGGGDVFEQGSSLLNQLQNFFNIGLPGFIAYYIDSDTQINENFGTSTTQSQLLGTLNQASDMAKELNFVMGYGSSALAMDIDLFQDTDVAANVQNITDFTSNLLGSNNFFSALTSNLATVAKGGKLTFPEIWSDSSFSKNYSIDIKLVSPDCDKFSIYMNILVPLFHLIALVAPQSINANPNGYMSPFLVRGLYKGMFGIDTGIITGMSVTKGSEGSWTRDGLPTEVSVNIDIKDLYEALSITNMQDTSRYDTMNNTALMDYIANSCGINIFKPEIYRHIDMWFASNIGGRFVDTFYNVFEGLETSIVNKIANLLPGRR